MMIDVFIALTFLVFTALIFALGMAFGDAHGPRVTELQARESRYDRIAHEAIMADYYGSTELRDFVQRLQLATNACEQEGPPR